MIKVKCINNIGISYLTENKIYISSKISKKSKKWIMVINDKSFEISYSSERFQLIKTSKIIELW